LGHGVANAAYGLNGIRMQLAAQVVDVHLYGVALYLMAPAVHLLLELLA
jgi:hypothetical protein